MAVELPKGVLVPFRGRPGRNNETRRIYEAWQAQGRPAVTSRVCDGLAQTFYAEEFASAKRPRQKKKIRDRIRVTIIRHELDALRNSSTD